MNCILNGKDANPIFKEIFDTIKAHGLTEIPYYACHQIGEGKVRCIENGSVSYYSGITEKDLVYFLFCLKKELTNGFVVSFDWGNDPIRKNVIMLPNADFKGCFDTKGTWMHLNYDIKSQTYVAYCNFMMGGEYEKTKKMMQNIEVKRLA